MADAEVEASRLKVGDCALEEGDLLVHERLVRPVRFREVGEDSVDREVRQQEDAFDGVQEFFPLRGPFLMGHEPDAAHAGIELQVDVCRLPDRAGDNGQHDGVAFGEDGHRQLMVDRGLQHVREDIAEDEDGFGHTVLPQFDPFFDGRDREGVDPDLLEGFRHHDGTVAIGVGLDDGHGLRVRSGMVHIPLHIVADVVEVDAGIDALGQRQVRGPGGHLRLVVHDCSI